LPNWWLRALPKPLSYERWLERELNLEAAALSAYVRAAQEGAPTGTGEIHGLLSLAWDGYQVICRQDSRYQPDTSLARYLQGVNPLATARERYAGYLQHLQQEPYRQHVLPQFVLTQLLAHLNGTGEAGVVGELFNALFTVHEIEDGAAYEDYDTGEVTYPQLTSREQEILTEVYGAQTVSSLTAD
jgi:hypothetical protein